jgi:hypothetical protein
VVEQGLGLSSVLGRRDELPDEALDVLVAAVMEEAVGQQRPADRLHVRLPQGTLVAPMGQDVTPPPPAGGRGEEGRGGMAEERKYI